MIPQGAWAVVIRHSRDNGWGRTVKVGLTEPQARKLAASYLPERMRQNWNCWAIAQRSE